MSWAPCLQLSCRLRRECDPVRLSRYDDQYLLVNHKRHPQEMVLLEDVGQVFDGAKLVVKIPQRRIYITCERTKVRRVRSAFNVLHGVIT